jgi:ADP-ribosylglycohydrolase
MLGAIIGDIVGSRFEFNPTNDYNFELFTKECSFTDDTICTIAVADALLKGRDYGESIHEWCRRYPNPMGGYGGRFRQWVMSNDPHPYGSYGNGSAMRVSAIGWWFDQPHDLLSEAEKSAACTHNHPDGIEGAQAVVAAIEGCRIVRKESQGKPITKDHILWSGIQHGVMMYEQFPQNFHVNIEEHRNKFDETCQGTVPVALAIILNSTSFEDAIRQAVSLGADADTLGAIVGSIAEALWGIPEWMKQKALSYLPAEMKAVVFEFHERLNRLRKLTKRCEFYRVGDFNPVEDENMPACGIEKEWAHDLAKSYTHADQIKEEMTLRAPLPEWQEIADNYDLPISLIGYTAKHILTPKHKSFKNLVKFLDLHYAKRKPQAEKKKIEKAQKAQFELIMFWKLSLGDNNKTLTGQDPLPNKDKVATKDSWQIQPMPDEETSTVILDMPITQKQMEILSKGHIPDVMEDHWFMYCDPDGQHIRYYRSWTGMCAFDATYIKNDDGSYLLARLTMNRALAEFGVNGDEAGTALFRYLITAELGGDAEHAWHSYLNAWEYLNKKYSKKAEDNSTQG